jgi:hypothetical protein
MGGRAWCGRRRFFMKSVLKRTRWARFWSAALVAAVLLAGCKVVPKLFENGTSAEPPGESGTDNPTGTGEIPDPSDPAVYPAEYVEPHSGTDGHDTIEELDLLKVLNVETVAEAIEELHGRIQNDLMGGLKLGMYLDLDSITPTGEDPILWDPTTQNLRIVIADFNQYKGKMGNDDTTNHIKFVFKNIPVTKQMRNKARNQGGYPYDGTGIYAESENGTPVLRPYLEGQFLPGLKTALGIADVDSYFYTVKRDIIIGSYDDGWRQDTFEAVIFIDTYMEASGVSLLEKENTHTQTALYIVDSDWANTTGRANGNWWTATPKLDRRDSFYCYWAFATSNNVKAPGVVPAFCIK